MILKDALRNLAGRMFRTLTGARTTAQPQPAETATEPRRQRDLRGVQQASLDWPLWRFDPELEPGLTVRSATRSEARGMAKRIIATGRIPPGTRCVRARL